MKIIAFIILTILLTFTNSYEILGGVPITFQIAGNVSYVPSSGGISTQGYLMNVGFYKYSWIGIKFMSRTSYGNTDVVIVQRASTSVGGYYLTTVGDYYISAANSARLLSDTQNTYDRNVESYDASNYFYIQIYRTKADTRGQDWEGGEFVSICFVTSDAAFNQSIWYGLKESCYGYDVSEDYISTFRGRYIGNFYFDGVSSPLYGGIQGPVLQMILFWYCPKSSLSNANVYIRIGDKISKSLGYDYYKCGTGGGDHFGLSASALTADTQWSGYNDGYCNISSKVGTKIIYNRYVYTGDEFDATIYNETEICAQVGGGGESCSKLKLQILYPIMDVDSALIIFEEGLRFQSIVLFIVSIIMFMY